MAEIKTADVKRIVQEVLAEQGLRVAGRGADPAAPEGPAGKGPRTLIVFHAGVRKLEKALEQVQRIEQASARSSVFTGSSARAWVCGADVRDQAGVRCILDTVSSEGLDRVLTHADVLVLPTLCLRVAARVASMTCDDQESGIVFSALLQGRKVLAARDGFMLCDILVNEALREEIETVLRKLERFGVVFCETESLAETFGRLSAAPGPGRTSRRNGESEKGRDGVPLPRLIARQHIMAAVNDNQSEVRMRRGGVVTALARDLAREYGLEIVEGERGGKG